MSGISEGFENGFAAITGGIKNIADFLGSILDSILSIPGLIVELLGDLLKALFIPDENYFDDKIEMLQTRFSFIESIKDTVNVFVNFFTNNSFLEPPVITVNLSSATGLDYGMSAKAIDFSWYAPFKKSVDMLLSSIMWVVFAWNTFKDVPNILSGVASGANATAELEKEATKRGL